MSAKPKIFVGSASETRSIVDALEHALRDDMEVVRWDLDTFRPGHFTLEDLGRATQEADFAAFVLGQEDATTSRGSITPAPRDNVVFEAGLFTAVLGRERVYYLVDSRGTKIPTDWKGLGYLLFDPDAGRERDKVYDAAREIRQQVARHGTRQSAAHWFIGSYWQFVENLDEGAVLSLLTITVANDGSQQLEIAGEAWSHQGELMARYRSLSGRYDPSDRELHYHWEGEHPRDPGRVSYVGIGEIRFIRQPKGCVVATGYFTSSPTNAPERTLVKSTRYELVTGDELNTMRSHAGDARVQLIQQKLSQRKTDT